MSCEWTDLVRSLFFVLLLSGLPNSLRADAGCDPGSSGAWERGESARVVSVVDGDTVVLDTSLEVRLVGIQAPKLGLGRRHFQDWPLSHEAKGALEKLTLGRDVILHYGGAREDRHGRLLAHLFRSDGVWAQAALLEQGLARVYSFPDNRTCVTELLVKETQARDARTGIWSLSYYDVLAADDLTALLATEDTYQLVEGRVRDVARVRGRTFLNFGSDWRTDFTIMIAARDVRAFSSALDPLLDHAVGRLVRVRGWMKSYNGPEIIATHPEQIEWLDDPPS